LGVWSIAAIPEEGKRIMSFMENKASSRVVVVVVAGQDFALSLLEKIFEQWQNSTYCRWKNQCWVGTKLEPEYILYIKATVVVSVCDKVVCSAQPCHRFYGRTDYSMKKVTVCVGSAWKILPIIARSLCLSVYGDKQGRVARAAVAGGRARCHFYYRNPWGKSGDLLCLSK
jgi:hypothetical protein